MREPLVSLIIPTYDGKDLLINLLKSLKNLDYKNYEVIIVDNGSSDNTYEFIKNRYTSYKFKIFRLENNLGFAGGMNFGIRHSAGDYIVVMNNDMEVTKKWLKELVDVAETDKNIGIVGSSMTTKNINFMRLGYLESNKIFFNFRPFDVPKNKKLPEIIQIDNTFGLTKKKLLEKIGLFDDKYFIYWEEVDLCYRAKKAGYKIVVATKAKIYHNTSSTMKKYTYQKIYHYHKNKIRFIMKNLGFYRIIVIPTTFIQFSGEIISYIIKGDLKAVSTILKSILWNLKNLRDYIIF